MGWETKMEPEERSRRSSSWLTCTSDIPKDGEPFRVQSILNELVCFVQFHDSELNILPLGSWSSWHWIARQRSRSLSIVWRCFDCYRKICVGPSNSSLSPYLISLHSNMESVKKKAIPDGKTEFSQETIRPYSKNPTFQSNGSLIQIQASTKAPSF